MGGSGIVWVTTCGAGVSVRIVRLVVTTRRTRFTFLGAWRWRATFFTVDGLPQQDVWQQQQFAAGGSATCIAPPPMSAPLQV